MGNQQKHRIVHVLHIPTRRDFPSFQPWSTPLASRRNQIANVERSRGDVNDVTRDVLRGSRRLQGSCWSKDPPYSSTLRPLESPGRIMRSEAPARLPRGCESLAKNSLKHIDRVTPLHSATFATVHHSQRSVQ